VGALVRALDARRYRQPRGAGRSRRLVEEALAVARRAGDKEALAGALNNLGILAAHSGALEDAIHHCSEALELRREIGHTRQVGNSLHNLGFLLMRQRRYEEARPFLHKSVEVATSLGDNSYAASSMIELAWCAFFEDDVDDAETTFRHALHLAHATANRRDVCEALVGIVGALVRRGRRERAEGILEIVAPLQGRYFGGADLVREYLADDLLEAGITVPTRDADHAASVAALDDLAEAVLEERSFERDTPGVNIG
jgi:tetratricopeptide (TPR) repeat protein